MSLIIKTAWLLHVQYTRGKNVTLYTATVNGCVWTTTKISLFSSVLYSKFLQSCTCTSLRMPKSSDDISYYTIDLILSQNHVLITLYKLYLLRQQYMYM